MKRKEGRLKLNRVINDRSGFTLAELLVVVGIIVILAGISFVAAAYYFKCLKLTAMDNTAKEIFIAAQNHLTSAQASGELERYKGSDEVKENIGEGVNIAAVSDEKALGKIMGYTPSDADEAGIDWPDPNEEYYYIRHDSNSQLDDSVLQYALPFGAIDDYVNTDGIYIIEYDVETASVYGVFYTESQNVLTADTVSELKNGRGGDDAAKKVRRNHKGKASGKNEIIGYYGGAMAADWRAESVPLELEVSNKERLTAVISDQNFKNTDKIVLKVHGQTSGNDALVTYNYGNAFKIFGSEKGNIPVVYDIDYGKSKGQTFGYIKDIPKTTAGSKDSREYEIVLDDLVLESGKNCHFAYLFPTFLPGEDITLTAYAYNNTGNCTGETAESKTVNSLFENTAARSEDGEKTAYISAFRHLENMDNSISGIQRRGNVYSYQNKYTLKGEKSFEFNDVKNVPSSTVDFIYTGYKQTEDMDWNDYYGGTDKVIAGISKKNTGEIVKSVELYDPGNDASNGSGNQVHEGTYFSIINTDMLEYDGGSHKISNVDILNNKSVASGDNDNGASNGALFGCLNPGIVRDCYIRDLVVENITVNAPKNAAAIVAESKVADARTLYFDNVLVRGNENTVSVITSNDLYRANNGGWNSRAGSNRGNGGALVAYCGSKLNVNECASTARLIVTGDDYEATGSSHLNAADVGGLAGELKNEGYFTNSYTGGITRPDGSYDTAANNYNIIGTYTAGGILGRASNKGVTISSCYSTCSVYSKFSTNDAYTGYGGGLIGYQEKGSTAFTNAYATGLIGGPDSAKGQVKKTLKGTLIGAGSASFSGAYYLDGINGSLMAKGGTTSDPGGVANMNYIGMAAKAIGQSRETHPVNRTGAYPFRAVNKTGIGNASLGGAHYGDWPKDMGSADDLLFGYKEKIGDNEYWYVIGKNNNGQYYLAMDTLPKDAGLYMDDSTGGDSEWSYGFLCPTGKGNGLKWYFNVSDNDNITLDGQVYTKEGSDIQIGENSYTYWKFSEAPEGNLGNLVTTPEQKKVNTASRFVFNPDFAASISTGGANGKNDLGTASNMYQIRSESQLNSINDSTDYLSARFHQTLDIDLSLDGSNDFTAIGKNSGTGAFGGYYSGLSAGSGSSDKASYSIKNFSQEIKEPTEDAGLFARISKDATVENVNLIGKSVEEKAKDPDSDVVDITVKAVRASGDVDIGGFASYNEGTVKNCSAELVISTEKEQDNSIALPDNLICIGGMFGSNTNVNGSNAAVSDCQFKGELIMDNLKAASGDTRLRIGGFAGRNNKAISNCKAGVKEIPAAGETPKVPGEPVPVNIIIKSDVDMNNSRNDRIGGFVGEHQTATISGCDSNVELDYDTDGKQRIANVGGFAGYRESTNHGINSSYAYGTLKVNCKDSYKAYSLRKGSAIGRFGVNVRNDEPDKRASYVECWYQENKLIFVDGSGDIYQININ